MAGVLVLAVSVGMLGGCKEKITVDEIINISSQPVVEFGRQMDMAFADSVLTYDECKNILGFVQDGMLQIDLSGITKMEALDYNFSTTTQYGGGLDLLIDADDMEFAVEGQIRCKNDFTDEKDHIDIELGFYLVNEEDGYYLRIEMDNMNDAVRYLGTEDEFFGSGLDVSGILAEMNGKSFEEYFREIINNNIIKSKMRLEKDTVQCEGKECYVIKVDITNDMVAELINSNDNLAEILEWYSMTDIFDGITLNDLIKSAHVSCNLYYSVEDCSFVCVKADIIETVKTLSELQMIRSGWTTLGTEIEDFYILCCPRKEDVDVE